MKEVQVAVGVILQDQQVYICKRPDDKHQGGKWEFPGGKVDAGETVIKALARELAEEVGIVVNASEPLTVVSHDYGDKRVQLDVHLVEDFSGKPRGLEGQQGKWIPVEHLEPEDFPAANVAIIAALKQKREL